VKHITSKDPRKVYVVDLLKAESGGNKVTNLHEDGTHYIGDCHRYAGARKYERIGEFKVAKRPEIEEMRKVPVQKNYKAGQGPSRRGA
jgi:hypothetical protein